MPDIAELVAQQKLGNTGAAPSASRNWDFAYTWNSGGTTFAADFMNVTDTASAAGSLLIDRQVGGVSQFKVSKAGALTVSGSIGSSGTFDLVPSTASYTLRLATSGFYPITSNNVDLGFASGGFSWKSLQLVGRVGFDNGGSIVCAMARKANGVIEFNNGTTGSYTGSAFGAGSQTVAQLPAAATAGKGARSFVTDASATTFLSTVAGGGANNVPVVSDGTNWLIG